MTTHDGANKADLESALEELVAAYLLLCNAIGPYLLGEPSQAMDKEAAGAVASLLIGLRENIADVQYLATGEEDEQELSD